MRLFRHDPNTLWPTSLVDWLVILALLALALAMLIPTVFSPAWL